jgi:hypothetical protein
MTLKCNYELCVKVANKSRLHSHTRANILKSDSAPGSFAGEKGKLVKHSRCKFVTQFSNFPIMTSQSTSMYNDDAL